jgi:hypothetical protein
MLECYFIIFHESGKVVMNYTEKSTRRINHLTGELTYSDTITSYESKLPTEPPYIKLYTTDVANLCGLSPIAKNVLFKLMTMADYDGEILLPRGRREKFANELKSSLGSINNAITEITKAELIAREGTSGSGVYKLNPTYMARGKWRDIYRQRKSFRIMITYRDDGKEGIREIVTEQRDADVIPILDNDGNDSSNAA